MITIARNIRAYQIRSHSKNPGGFSRKKYLVEDTIIDNMYDFKALRDYLLDENSKVNSYFEDRADFDDCFDDIMYTYRCDYNYDGCNLSILESLCKFFGYCGLGFIGYSIHKMAQKYRPLGIRARKSNRFIKITPTNRITIRQKARINNGYKK